MEIVSSFVQNEAIGSLHVVNFAPNNNRSGEQNVVFNSFNGRSTTIDGFALPYEVALATNTNTVYVERPATGLSSLPLDNGLRRDYLRHGFTAVSAAVDEALYLIPGYGNAANIHSMGFSLGGSAAAEYAERLDNRAASAVLWDAAGFCRVNRYVGVARYFAYLGVEAIANKVGLKPSVEEVFRGYRVPYEKYREANLHPEPPIRSREEKRAELNELKRPPTSAALNSLLRVMSSAAENRRSFELRAGFTPGRLMMDHQYVRYTNQALEKFDLDHPGQETVKYGFLQDGPMRTWHDIACNQKSINILAMLNITLMDRRLRYR